MDKESNIGSPCACRNRHGNSVPIPDRDSTMSPSHECSLGGRSAQAKYIEMDAHAKYDQKRRAREGRIGKYLPKGP